VSIYELKPRFQALLRPLVGRLARAGVTANQVTVAACSVSVALGVWLFFGRPDRWAFALIPLWMFLRMAFNAIDGMLAREHGQKSALGAFLNELMCFPTRRCTRPSRLSHPLPASGSAR